jgi:ketosteroid isomerase-like protein
MENLKRMERHLTLFVMLLCLFGSSFTTIVSAQERKVTNLQNSRSEIEDAILRLERETMDAIKRKDAVALGKILADDFTHRSPGGVESGKADFLKSIASLPVEVTEIWGEELKVSIFGETVVLTGVQRVKTKSADGTLEAGAGAFTDVFVRRRGRWLMVLAYSVDMPVVDDKNEGK